MNYVRYLKSYFKERGYDLSNNHKNHNDAVLNITGLYAGHKEEYGVIFETKYIQKKAYKKDNLKKFKKIYTWNEEILNIYKSRYVSFPNNINVNNDFSNSFDDRKKFSVMVAGNKIAELPSSKVLYQERFKIIKWFEKNNIDSFELYGSGWDAPFLFNNVIKKLFNILKIGRAVFPLRVYKGKVLCKSDILSQSKFSFCLENVVSNNYITEKIFDSFVSGCVPIYWGPNNIDNFIPKETYIDYRNFKSLNSMLDFLQNIDYLKYRTYQDNIYKFLQSEMAFKLSDKSFAKNVVDDLIGDLSISV
ncbi:glycosyltransferase family 10 domain-containing protein [Polynucleobacter sp. 30F-ANTBAC]|uniref:glycosyltransferase family 10 domain-containing protein n=1 Tax=Polynucleobacter sp. 30F-ANTBAC TaxID=2689095 RepID=UPI001C0B0B91|nr:glycosyltransferase family 10 [Polynucleobacter sp. 30F-ANTBAC]